MDTTNYVTADAIENEGKDNEPHSRAFKPNWLTHPSSVHAQILSKVSCFITASAAVFGFILWIQSGYLSILAYGMENLLDFLSSLIIVWRFFPPKSVDDPKSIMLALRAKEKRSSIGVSFVILLLGIQVVVLSLVRFNAGNHLFAGNEYDEMTIFVALPSAIVFGTLAMIKLNYANKLESPALRKDGFCSAAGTILSLAVVLEIIVSGMDQNIWYLDPFIAFLVGVVCIFIGARTIFLKNKEVPFLSLAWWAQSAEHSPAEPSHVVVLQVFPYK